MFPDDYEPHGVKMLYDGEPVDLPPAAEELATFYARAWARAGRLWWVWRVCSVALTLWLACRGRTRRSTAVRAEDCEAVQRQLLP